MPGPNRGSGGLGRSAYSGGLESGAPPAHGDAHGHSPIQGAGCCWPLFCVCFFVALASSGTLAIQKLKDCSRGDHYGNGDGNHDNHHHNSTPNYCTDYTSVHSMGVVIFILVCCYYCCYCCCCRCSNRRPRDGRYDPIDETVAGSTYIMATDASAPAVVYANEPFQPSAPTVADTGFIDVTSNIYGPIDPA